MEFSKGTGFMFNRYVNLVLNTLSNNEHEKYLQYKQNQLKSAIPNGHANSGTVAPVSSSSSDLVGVKQEKQ